jgi:hypothetical protein
MITWQPVDLPLSIVTGNLLNWVTKGGETEVRFSAEFSHVVGRKRRKFNCFLFNEMVRFWFLWGLGFRVFGGSGHRVNKFSQQGQVKELL